MKYILMFLLTCYAALAAPESYFFRRAGFADESNSKIENGKLVTSYTIEKIDFKISAVEAYYQGLGNGRNYQIEIHATGIGSKIGPPYLKLEDDLLMNLKYLSYPEGRQSMTIESDDREKIERWVAALRRFSGLPESKVVLNLDRRAEQPADGKTRESPQSPR
jgi:hypothetical protein